MSTSAGGAFQPRPAPALRGLQAYKVPRPPIPIDLRLDGNEGLLPSPDLIDSLREAGPQALRLYPDAGPLEAALAERHGVAPEQVLVTAGADEALDRIFRAFTWPGREAVLPWPSFVMIPHYGRLAGATMRTVPWLQGELPTREVLQAVGEATSLVFCVSPNNPTGAVASRTALTSLFQGVSTKSPEALVVLDHAYAEFADEDLTDLALSFPNGLVLRTFSKARGLAGLRIGYALGPPEVIRLLRAAGGPYPVSAASLVLAWAALRASSPAESAYLKAVRDERERLPRLLQDLGAACLPSQGNFVLARFGAAEWVRDALAGLGIGVRLFPGEEALEQCLRITCPGAAEGFARLEHALRAALAPRALLFDLDGVLVDATGGRLEALGGLPLFASLRSRLPLGVVTGLSRGEATRLLTVSGLLPLVSVLVAREDAPPKPAAAPVALCLQRLGVQTAWMLGDQPTDVAAARAAGAIPLGVVPPALREPADEERRAAHARSLHEAGAARVLDGCEELGALLDGALRHAVPFDASAPHGASSR